MAQINGQGQSRPIYVGDGKLKRSRGSRAGRADAVCSPRKRAAGKSAKASPRAAAALLVPGSRARRRRLFSSTTFFVLFFLLCFSFAVNLVAALSAVEPVLSDTGATGHGAACTPHCAPRVSGQGTSGRHASSVNTHRRQSACARRVQRPRNKPESECGPGSRPPLFEEQRMASPGLSRRRVRDPVRC